MQTNQNTVLTYFKYDLEKILDEFNNYYNIKSAKIPLHLHVLYLYFSHLAENGLQVLINSNYNINYAKDLEKVPAIYLQSYTTNEILNFARGARVELTHFYGLSLYSYYFFEMFLYYIKYNNEVNLNTLFKNIPIVNANLELIKNLAIKKFP